MKSEIPIYTVLPNCVIHGCFVLHTAFGTTEMREFFDSEDFQLRFDAGVTVPSTSLAIEQRDDIICSLVMHYLVFCKAELDQLKQGLSELKILQLLLIARCYAVATFIVVVNTS